MPGWGVTPPLCVPHRDGVALGGEYAQKDVGLRFNQYGSLGPAMLEPEASHRSAVAGEDRLLLRYLVGDVLSDGHRRLGGGGKVSQWHAERRGDPESKNGCQCVSGRSRITRRGHGLAFGVIDEHGDGREGDLKVSFAHDGIRYLGADAFPRGVKEVSCDGVQGDVIEV